MAVTSIADTTTPAGDGEVTITGLPADASLVSSPVYIPINGSYTFTGTFK